MTIVEVRSDRKLGEIRSLQSDGTSNDQSIMLGPGATTQSLCAELLGAH